LEEIPLALAENSGYNPIEYVSELKKLQIEEKLPFFGVDGMRKGTTHMMQQGVYESAVSKKQQLELATQVVKMILKIDELKGPDDIADAIAVAIASSFRFK